MDKSFKKTLYNLLQPSNKVTLIYKNEQDIASKEALVIVRAFDLNGVEIGGIRGLPYSQGLKAYYQYLPEGINLNYKIFLNLEFDKPAASIRVDFMPWRSSKGKIFQTSTLTCRTLEPVTHDQSSLKPIAVGVFESIEKEII